MVQLQEFISTFIKSIPDFLSTYIKSQCDYINENLFNPQSLGNIILFYGLVLLGLLVLIFIMIYFISTIIYKLKNMED